MKAVNLTNRKELASDLVVARSLLSRIRGLLGRSSLPQGEALLIKPCMGIHTFGMRFAIDAVFLDRTNRVVAVAENLLPNHMTRLYFKAASVIELPAGTIGATGIHLHDEIEIA